MATLAAELREMVEEQIRFRALLLQMTKRDLLIRYKQTVMGFAWAVFMPLIQTGIFATMISRISTFDPGIPYPLFAFTGVLAWNFFASAIRFASISLSGNSSLVSKVYFPREIFPMSQVLVCFVDSLVAGVVVVGMMFWYGIVPGIHVLMLPVIFLIHILWTAAAAFILSAANLFFRDVKYIVEGLLTVAMFSTTALYPSSQFTGTIGVIMRFNPISAVIDAYRSALFYDAPVLTRDFIVSALGAVIVFSLSWLIFHRAEHTFAERI